MGGARVDPLVLSVCPGAGC